MNFLAPVIIAVILSPLLLIISENWRKIIMAFTVTSLLYAALYLLVGEITGKISFFSGVLQHDSLISLSIHPYSRIAAFGFALVGALGLVFGFNVSSKKEQFLSVIAIASAMGVAFADNFLTFLFFWEALTFSTSFLIFSGGTARAMRMAYRVFFLQLIGGFSLTIGIFLHYFASGSLAVGHPEAGLPFFIIGIGMKTAFIFLHFWVPWGYPEASFPSSVLLAALCTKVGVYGFARIIPPGENMALMGAVMAIVAVTFALMQSDLRRLLSFHIISQVGYMIAGVGLGHYLSVDGGLLHLVNHMLYKALLFMSAGAVLYATGTENLHDLHHSDEGTEESTVPFYRSAPRIKEHGTAIWKAMPVVAAGAVVGALAISGTPLFNGYVSKYLLKKAVHGFDPVETILLVAGVGTALSFCKFVYFGFLAAKSRIQRLPDIPMQAGIGATAFLCILFGVVPGLMSSLLPYNYNHYILHVYSSNGVFASLKIIGIGILIFIIMAKLLEKIHFPSWLNADQLLFTPFSQGLIYAFTFTGNTVEKAVDTTYVKSPGPLASLCSRFSRLEETVTPKVGRFFMHSAASITGSIYQGWMTFLTSIFNNLNLLFQSYLRSLFQADYRPKEKIFKSINIANMDFNLMIIIVTLLLILSITIILN